MIHLGLRLFLFSFFFFFFFFLQRIPARSSVGSPGRYDALFGIFFVQPQSFHSVLDRGLFSSSFLHTSNLVPYNFAPITPVLVGLYDSNTPLFQIVYQNGLFPFFSRKRFHIGTIGTFHPVLFILDQTIFDTGIDDGNGPSQQFFLAQYQTEWCQSGTIVFQQHSIHNTEDPSVAQTPPNLGIHRHGFVFGNGTFFIRIGSAIKLLITFRGGIHLEILVVIVGVVVVHIHTNFVAVVAVGNGRIQSYLTPLLVIDGTNFETIGVAPQQTTLLSSIPTRTAPHDTGLGKDATAPIGIGTLLAGNRRKGNAVLIILSQMKMSTEPGLDTAVFPYQFDKSAALSLVGMVQPATAVHDVIFLQYPQATAVGRSVRKDENFPTSVGGMLFQQILEPIDLGFVNNDLVRCVRCLPKNGRTQSHQQRLIGNFATKLRRRLAVLFQKELQILSIRTEFVNAFQVMIPPNYFVRDTKTG
mmetsp:Transcript_2585/g.3843  ORF Transcript_2585/g.3843 Transcript_2585/m.3843 type:complete len:470 (-) Transcript_2585:387-1796(-)